MPDPKYVALCAKRDALLAKANKVQAKIDALVERHWQRAMADMQAERAAIAAYFANLDRNA
jgi:hypothetical protein